MELELGFNTDDIPIAIGKVTFDLEIPTSRYLPDK